MMWCIAVESLLSSCLDQLQPLHSPDVRFHLLCAAVDRASRQATSANFGDDFVRPRPGSGGEAHVMHPRVIEAARLP